MVQNPNRPVLAAEVAWNADPNDPVAVPVWTDLAAGGNPVLSMSTKRGRQYELDQNQAGTASLVIENQNEKLSPANTASPYHPNVIPYRQIRLTATWLGVTYPLHKGYVERWPLAWESAGYRGLTDTSSVDAMAALAAQALRTEYSTAILDMAPDYYWPLGEPEGAQSFGEVSGHNGPSLVYKLTKAGGGSITAGSASGIEGDPSGTGVMFNEPPPSPIYSNSGTGIQTGGPNTRTTGVDVAEDTGAWALTVALRVRSPLTAATYIQKLFAFARRSRFGQPAFPLRITMTDVGVYADLIEQVTADEASGINVQIGRTATLDDDLSHLVIATVNVTAGGSCTVALYLDDGTNNGSTTTAIGTAARMASSWVEVGANTANMSAEGAGPLMNAALSHIAVWRRVITPTERTALWTAGLGYPGELSGTRVTRYLAHGFEGASSISPGLSYMGTATLADGGSLLDALQGITESENGNLYVDGAGVLQYKDRSERYYATTPTYVFGDGPGELPYEEDIEYDFDVGRVVNDVSIERPEGLTAHREDATSQARYFRRSLTRTHNVSTDLEAEDAAAWFLARGKDPVLRVEQVTLVPSANTALWPAALGCEIGTRVTVNRRPRSGSVITADYFVESVEHQMSPESWRTTFGLSPAAPSGVWILQDGTYGRLDSTTRLGY